jgi:hypothetical protein
MVDSPDSHFIVQKPACVAVDDTDDNRDYFEQRESSASWCSRVQGYFF